MFILCFQQLIFLLLRSTNVAGIIKVIVAFSLGGGGITDELKEDNIKNNIPKLIIWDIDLNKKILLILIIYCFY